MSANRAPWRLRKRFPRRSATMGRRQQGFLFPCFRDSTPVDPFRYWQAPLQISRRAGSFDIDFIAPLALALPARESSIPPHCAISSPRSDSCTFARHLSLFSCVIPLLCASCCSGVSNPSSPSVMNGWDSHAMLEHYIYEYMIKKQMHETAEIFKREAALNFETALPGDGREGFLYEWWLIFYDTFMESQPNNGSSSGSSPTMMTTFPQETTASLTRQSVMNEEMTKDLAINTNTRLTFGDSFMWSKEWPSTNADHHPQNLMPLPYQQNPSTFSSTLNPVVVTDDLIAQGGAHLMPPGLENHLLSYWKSEDHKKIIALSRLAESSKKRKASAEGNSGMPGFFLLQSENSEDNPSDMSAEANSSQVNEMNGEANVCSSTSKERSSASDASKGTLHSRLQKERVVVGSNYSWYMCAWASESMCL